MTEKSDVLNRVERLCIINFLELQEMKRKLSISTENNQDFYDYQNAASDYIKELDSKMSNLIKDFPHLLND